VLVYIFRGYTKHELKQYRAAIKDYDKAFKLDPKGADVYVVRGAAKAELKQYDAAIKDYDKAIELNPKEAYAYICRGDVKAISLNQPAAVAQDYQTALRLAKQANNKALEAKILEALELLQEI
jgi:tetratricopeptide (TPR) repeat protein